ncbi:MAG: tetratricopeptide repeat protein [Bacteroidota bacterium]|nr:tetratricopeptide repeat protein [Bacteroidota bacterium]
MTLSLKLFILLTAVAGLVFGQVDSTGIKLINQRKYSEAQSFFESVIQKNNKNAEAYYFLSIALMRQQKSDDAQDAIEEAIDINETVSKYHMMRGNILGQKAMTANVISQGFLAPKIKNAFLRASELDPNNVDARASLYNYYIMAPGIMGGSEEKALEQANAIVKLNPYRGYNLLSTYYARVKKDTVEAEQQIKKAIAVKSDTGDGYKRLGYLYTSQKRFAEAYTQMKKFVELEPTNPDSYDSYADVLKTEQKYDQAIEKYLYALSIDKNFSASIFSLAECYELKELKQKAKETYQWFLTVEPQGRRAESAQKKIKEL